jgi:hypothetical protein
MMHMCWLGCMVVCGAAGDGRLGRGWAQSLAGLAAWLVVGVQDVHAAAVACRYLRHVWWHRWHTFTGHCCCAMALVLLPVCC